MDVGFSTPKYTEMTIFDLSIGGLPERLGRELAAWGNSAHVEYLGWQRAALLVRPGGALGLLRSES